MPDKLLVNPMAPTSPIDSLKARAASPEAAGSKYGEVGVNDLIGNQDWKNRKAFVLVFNDASQEVITYGVEDVPSGGHYRYVYDRKPVQEYGHEAFVAGLPVRNFNDCPDLFTEVF